jgi:hypothetical protein
MPSSAVSSKSVRKIEPKKRASAKEAPPPTVESSPSQQTNESSSLTTSEPTKKSSVSQKEKKQTDPSKGRKTRGSKIITKQQMNSTITTPPLTNVILNLKCSMSDLKEYNDKLSRMISNPLEYNSSAPPEVKYYDGETKFGSFIQPDISCKIDTQDEKREEKSITAFLSFSAEETATGESFGTPEINNIAGEHYIKINKTDLDDKKNTFLVSNEDIDDVNVKDMSAKLKQLKIQLYKNTLHSEKKSACFWCTYDFDNAPCYIPKYEMDDTIYGYGSFCRPECAVAYLMKESIDDSTKFDRYQLLNQIYSKVYDCKKNIKPAPDPHYLLDKFYGNLNIQEYRRLLKTEHLLLVIDKPLTRILPELHEDTDDAFTKIYGIKATSGNSSGVYKVKRQSEQPQGPSKASIIKNTFGI